jgi:uncharacterized protein
MRVATLTLAIFLTFSALDARAASEVADAAMNNDLGAVRSLLRQKSDVNKAQADGATALHWAVRWDNLQAVELLIQSGANVKAANRFGVTPMSLACVNGSAAIIRRLLKAGVDPNAPLSELGETALMVAAQTGNVDAVAALLEHGADVNAREISRGGTAIMWAAAEAHPAVVKALIDHGADVNSRSGVAAEGAAKDGPAQDQQSSGATTALVLAARQDDRESARVLLDAGADINLTMSDGTSALVVAIINGHYELAKLLLDRGANVNLADSKGRTALYAAIEMRNMGVTDMPAPRGDNFDVLQLIREIVARGADINVRLKARLPYRGGINPSWLPEPGATPFYRAAAANDVTVMRLLLERGADPLLSANDKTTPLMVAAGVGWLPGISYTWSEKEMLEAIEICLKAGHDLHATNAAGLTALHGAAFRGANAAVRFLVDRGAQLDAKDKDGRVPLNWAEGVYFAGQPPRREGQTVVLLEELMRARGLSVEPEAPVTAK